VDRSSSTIESFLSGIEPLPRPGAGPSEAGNDKPQAMKCLLAEEGIQILESIKESLPRLQIGRSPILRFLEN
jgi:hypothetical protein